MKNQYEKFDQKAISAALKMNNDLNPRPFSITFFFHKEKEITTKEAQSYIKNANQSNREEMIQKENFFLEFKLPEQKRLKTW